MPKSKREYKTFEFNLTETKEIEDENGQKFGIIKGYASTFDNIDRGDDRILRGAFGDSLALYKVKNRLIKMHFQHYRDDVIGGFNPEKMFEDAKGLFVEGAINLEVQRGREVYALAKQGVLTDFSIGFSVDDFSIENGIRELKKLTLWEISVVGEPMNTDAIITEVKTALPFKNLALADRDKPWDKAGANKRVRDFTGSTEKPTAKYKNAFMWYDAEDAENFGAYKLQYVDVVDGSLKAIPRAIFAIAGVLRGARGGVDIPSADKTRVEAHVNKYYDKMDLDSPLKEKDFQFEINDIDFISNKKEFEKLLRDSGIFSRKAAIFMASFVNLSGSQSESDYSKEKNVDQNDQLIMLLKEALTISKTI